MKPFHNFAIASLLVASAAASSAANPPRDDAATTVLYANTNKRSLRGSSSSENSSTAARAALDARLLFPTADFDPLADFARTGLDRSLSYINPEVEFSLPLDQEQWDAIGRYIHLYSKDGNDDSSDAMVAPFYEEEIVPEDEPSTLSRKLMPGGHSGNDFIESSCNVNLDETQCADWSTWINGTDYTTEVKIPCGQCVRLDASPNEAMYGSTLQFDEGLNIVGKLLIPNDAAVELVTRYVYVQGIFEMPSPAEGSSTGIPSEESGDRVVITLWGLDDLMFDADNATDNTHIGTKGVNNKAIVIAGGRLNITAIDPTCPSWVKLQSISYGTPLPNVALSKPASQSSNYGSNSASYAVDGIETSFTHTTCTSEARPWWMVDLQDTFTIGNIKITNRLDCCGGRLSDFDIRFLDASEVEISSIHHPGRMGARKTFSTDYVSARYVKIQRRVTDCSNQGCCLQLGEVEVFGYRTSEGFPTESLDILTVGEDAARCWSTKGSRIMLTSDTIEWDDSHTVIVADAPSPGPGQLAMLPLPKKKTAVDETFGYPDFAVEVALLDRSFHIHSVKESGGHQMIGGHVIVLHTPMVQQHLEGALLTNMGQQARLGRYPLHFHMSECVHGSTLAKNVIWESNQRCIVIHGTHNVTLSENVAYDTKGHCFMLEDGGEWDNEFLNNLGAKTDSNIKIRPEETDNDPATFWITNPANHWIGNVAAGSKGSGFWFELKLRGPSAGLDINQGVNPTFLKLGTFDDNTAHSNTALAGITTYRNGYRAPPGTTWNNIKAFKNKQSGLFQHGTNNIDLVGGLLADNREAARNFHHEWAIYDGVEVIGRSEHVKDLISQGRIWLSDPDCHIAGGISIQPNEGMGLGTTIKNCIFSGFDTGCTGGKHSAVWVENDQVRNAVFDASPSLVGNTFGANDTTLSACLSINHAQDGWVRYIAIEDPDGAMSRSGAGFFVQDEPAITNFIDTACEADHGCMRFCPGACLRLGIISISQDFTTRGFQMQITDGDKAATILRGPIWFDEKQNHLSAQMPFVLPEPTTDHYTITFTDASGTPAWPGYATISLEKKPTCTGGLVDQSQLRFAMPVPDGRCDDLFSYDDYDAGIHGWQNFFTGMQLSQDEGSPMISTVRRKDDRGHVNLSRTLDASCFKGLPGRSYTLFGKIKISDATGNCVATDGTSRASPKITFNLDGVFSRSWFVPTSADCSFTDWSEVITLPDDVSAVWKATIIINEAEKKEFHIKDWGMNILPSEAPTTSPTNTPSQSPTTSQPSTSPTKSPSNSPITPSPVTYAPTLPPATAAPVSSVPTNLALNGLASADAVCHNGWAYNVIDGNPNTGNHGCNNAGSWVKVDLGKDTVNHIDTVIVKNSPSSAAGRLKRFYIEILDARKSVVWSEYHGWSSVGSSVVLTYPVNGGAGAQGRWVRLRFEDSYQNYLHIAELEAWGYPTDVPVNPPAISELAFQRPATQSSTYHGNVAGRAVDGIFTNTFHTWCGAHPWWMVDLGVESFIRDIIITNRVGCCGGRLRQAFVEILDSEKNLVESRYIQGSVGDGKKPQFVFNEETSVGRYIKVRMPRNDCLHLTEVEVFGYHTMGMPSASPTPMPQYLSLNKPAIQSSTYNTRTIAAFATDNVDTTFTHTHCHWSGFFQWWQVDLEDMYTINSIEVVNRLNCCGGRLHDYNIFFLDDSENMVDTMFSPGGNGNYKTHSVDLITARYVKIQLTDTDCLQLGEVRIYGW